MSADDRLTILDMIGRYAHAWDGRDCDAYAACFTEDAVFEVWLAGQEKPVTQWTSREAIREWARSRHADMAAKGVQSRHVMSDTVFDELQADSARTRTVLCETNRRPEDAVPWIVGTGVYHDEWRRTPQGWRLARRAIHNDRWEVERLRETLPPVGRAAS